MHTAETEMDGTAQAVQHTHTIAAVTDQKTNIHQDLELEDQRNNADELEDPRNFTIPIYKKLKIRIYKPLITLKIALFVWYGAGSVYGTFLTPLLKQRGITLIDMSNIHALTATVQFLGPTICGIIADKIGRAKPVLVSILLLTAMTVVGILATPTLHSTNCDSQPIKLECDADEFGHIVSEVDCGPSMNVTVLDSCNVTCPMNVTGYCNEQNLICEILENENFENFSLSVNISGAYRLNKKCHYNLTSMSYKYTTYSHCNVTNKMHCKMHCLIKPEIDCPADDSGHTRMLIVYTVLLILMFTVVSITYRIMDVTSMILVKAHNADFGQQRFFGIAGTLVLTPLSGYIIQATTEEGGYENYDMALYLFIGMLIVFLAIIYKLEVEIRPPGKNMWMKSFYLLKNPDVITFVLVLIVLGTCFNFTGNFQFWYLAGMNSPSILLGLVNSLSGLYGLPFLLTSNWWVKKLGATQIFLLAIFGYAASGIGFSFLYNPWYSLLLTATSIITYHLLWVAVITHSHNIAPDGLTATVIAAAGGIHYGLGKGFGGSLGGLVYHSFGGRITFRVMAYFCLTSGVLYAIYLCLRRICRKK